MLQFEAEQGSVVEVVLQFVEVVPLGLEARPELRLVQRALYQEQTTPEVAAVLLGV